MTRPFTVASPGPLPPTSMPPSTVLFCVFLCVLFGANAVAIKIGFQGFGVYAAAAIRFAAASAAVALWAFLTGRPLRVPKPRGPYLLVYSVVFTLQISFFYTGISRSLASRATLIVNTLPFLILLLSHFFLPGDRITPRKFAGILLGFGGVAVLSLDAQAVSAGFRTGDAFCLAAVTLWAGNTVFLKRFLWDLRPYQIVFHSMISAVPAACAASFFLDPFAVNHPGPAAVSALLYQTFVTAVFGFIAWNTLLQRYGAAALHTFLFIMPPVGVALGGLLLGEPVNPNILASTLLIAAGIATVHAGSGEPVPLFGGRGPGGRQKGR